MLATLIIVFRELIEAGLVVGIVLAATRGVAGRSLWVGYGVAAGLLGACMVALFAKGINAAMAGFGQEFFNAGVLLLAVLMLTWHNVWMAKHGREMAREMKSVGEAVSSGSRSLLALAIVVGIALLREGSEIVLFLYGIAVSGNETLANMVIGAAIGVVLGVGCTALTYFGLLRIPNRYLFLVTGWMIALLSAGMAAQAVAFLEQAQVVNRLGETAWHSGWLVSQDSITGKTLHTLVGYNESPTIMQVFTYLFTLLGTFALMKWVGGTPAKKMVLVRT